MREKIYRVTRSSSSNLSFLHHDSLLLRTIQLIEHIVLCECFALDFHTQAR